MMKYDLLLCSSIFYECYVMQKPGLEAEDEEIEMHQVLRKHRFVISDNMMRIYKEYAQEHACISAFDSFQQWYANLATTAESKARLLHIFDEEMETKDIDLVIEQTVKNPLVKKPVVICGGCPKCRALYLAINPITIMISSNILEETIDNKLRRNIYPFSVDTIKNESIESYIEWFQELLDNQSTICIFNRYAYTESEFRIMVDIILKHIQPHSSIKLYIDQQAAGTPSPDIIERNREIKQLATDKQLDISVFSYDHSNSDNRTSYHDRKIILRQEKIAFTAPFSCLCTDRARKLLVGNNNISCKQCNAAIEVGNILSTHPGYFEVWNNSKAPEDFVLSN